MPDDVRRALRPFTTGCVKLQLPSLRRDAWHHNGGKLVTSPDLVVILNVFCRKYDWYKVDCSCYNRDWSRSVGSYGNNTLVICCTTGTSLVCCCRNSLPTVISPLNTVHPLVEWGWQIIMMFVGHLPLILRHRKYRKGWSFHQLWWRRPWSQCAVY